MQRKGQAMTEYALILAALAVIALTSYRALGSGLGPVLNSVIAGL